MSKEAQADETAAGLIRFIHRAGRLKVLARTGWLDRGVPSTAAESVADHSFRTALLAWLAAAANPDLDRDRVLKLALIHDLAEALTGDIPPYDPAQLPDASNEAARRRYLERRHRRSAVRAEAKRGAEAAALRDLASDLPVPLAAELLVLWEEAAAQSTPEARFVKQVDRLETYLQSREYLAVNPDLPIASFAREVAEVITDPALAALRQAIERGAGS